jgi:hypothetical protein
LGGAGVTGALTDGLSGLKTEILGVTASKEALKEGLGGLKTEILGAAGITGALTEALGVLKTEILAATPSKREFTELQGRVGELETKLAALGDTRQPVINNSTPKVPTSLGPDPPLWMTFSKREDLKSVAKDVGFSAEVLQEYNQTHNPNFKSDSSFWGGGLGERVMVLLPEIPLGTRPKREFRPDKHRFDNGKNLGRIIAQHFRVAPVDIKVDITRNGVLSTESLDLNENYGDCLMTIKATPYPAPPEN